MTKEKVQGFSPKEFFAKISRRRKPQPRDKIWDTHAWSPKPTLDEEIINFMLGNHMTSEDFMEYVNKNIKPIVDEKIKHQREEREKAQREFDERKRIKALPENALVSAYLGKRAYPKHFDEITKKYSLSDFKRVRNLALEGNIPNLGANKTEFLTWINSIIDQKRGESEETDNILRKPVNAFRGH